MKPNYELAYKNIIMREGFYVNNIFDRGQETFCGISRKWFPNWKGWELIDNEDKNLPANKWSTFNVIMELVYEHYKENFWDKLKCDKLRTHVIAETLFDVAVNCGCSYAAKSLQRTLNYLTKDQLKVDGIIGNKTLTALKKLKPEYYEQNETKIVFLLIVYRQLKYFAIVQKDPTQKVFAHGWLNRNISLLKELLF